MAWKRDPSIQSMIDWLDQGLPSKLKISLEDWDRLPSSDKFESCSPSDRQAIMEQARECSDDFSYAARNFFFITTKKKQDQLFTLWESQYLILQEFYRLKAMGKAQKLIITKGRQVGASTLIEGMIAWRTMFFPNTNAIVVSVDQKHSSYLFGLMLHIYDKLPWWLKPMIARREEQYGLWFENPDENQRSRHPGLNSKVFVQWSNQYSGVGQGIPIDAGHICFSPTTKVRVADGALKEIQKIVKGETAITGFGRESKVRGVFKSSRKNEETAKLTLWGLSQFPLETTKDHRILTPDGYRMAGEIKKGDYVSIPIRPISEEILTIGLTHNRTGRPHKGEPPISTTEEVPLGFEFGWLCGLYLAEGTIQLNHKLQERLHPSAVYLSLHQKEQENVRKNIDKVFPGIHVGGYQHRKSKTYVLRVSDAGLSRFLYEHFGHGEGKTIPDWCWQAGKQFCRGVVKGYLDGDGFLDKDGIRVNAQSVRPAILVQLRDLVASLGHGWSTLYSRPAGQWYGRNCQSIWGWNACGGTGMSLRRDFGWECGTRQVDPGGHWAFDLNRNQIAIEVAGVEQGFSEEFYDLEVEAVEHNFCTLQCAVANSEFADFLEEDLEAIVNEDLANSMADDPEVFGFMESTGKGAGTAAHLLWRACERRLDAGKWPKWYPVFIPTFFETTRVLAPPNGWTIPHKEFALKERIKKEWVRCNSSLCGRYHKAVVMEQSMIGAVCPECKAGKLMPLVLTDEQLYWHQDRREQAEEQGVNAVKKLKQEHAVTSEESWQVSGYVLFNDACREWMSETIEEFPLKKGKIYRDNGEIHGSDPLRKGRCFVPTCNVDHRHDDTPFWVWEEPIKGATYSIAVDVSEGIGEDYSVIFVNKIGGPHRPDEQVAVFRDNHTYPKDLAFYANVIGKRYNYGEMCVEYNTYQTTGDDLLYVYHYPNVYRWKHKDKINPMSQTWHWWTKPNTKAYLHQTAVDWLLSHCWVIRSKNFFEETTTYRKEEYASRSFGAASNCNDDELMAGMIALYTAHELDCDETGRIQVPVGIEESAPARYKMTCLKCKTVWGAANPEKEYRCPNEACQSIRITGEATTSADPRKTNLDEAFEWISAQRDNEKPAEVELGLL